MQTITPNTSLAQVIQNPLGRDLLEKVLLNFGFKPEDFERSALSKLKVKALSPLTGGVIKKSTVQMFCDLLNSESNAIIAPDDSPITPQWWKEAVFYQIYPRSFKDSNGDGIGDINGIIEKLDYLKDLGVDCIWCSPMYKSPNDDNGYDISDYYDIMDDFGTMADFDRLLREVHQRGMRLIMDLVVNHTSDEHPWFEAAKQDRHNKYHQYYIWRRDDGSHTPPNNWESLFSGSAWNYYEAVDSWAMHAFSKKQMDLNWENPAVRHDIYKMINWWLDKGIDGFRMDVINFISKWPSLPDGDPVVGKTLGFCGAEFYFYGPCLHAYLHEMNRNCFGRGDKEYVTVGECGGLGIETAKLTTADTRQELSMVFNFDHLDNPGHMRFDEYQYDLRKAVKTILKWQVEYTNHCWPTLLFENHDNPRVTSKVDPTDTYTSEIAKLCAVLEMTLKGSPFVYQGQELGMTNTHFDSMDDVRDVESINFYNKLVAKGKKPEKALRIINGGSRDHGRTPMQWTAEPGAGFTDGTPWIGINKNAVRLNAADEAKVPDSVLNDFKRLIALRHANPALVYGEFTQLCPEDKNVVCYKRTLDGNTFFVELCLPGFMCSGAYRFCS
jgi:oligo-1,6-glucosidase